ncbi:hypothetical protein SO802_006615 [Lithocarpus litseifolius]|uniref:RNase H type-1 domain-containing protein n=1 Tax=Lithocarpus litseifolius TaxID=425828 RepID=A0AAW2DNY1_9ROSI
MRYGVTNEFFSCTWCPPTLPFLKRNFDVVVRDNHTCQATLCRDHSGKILLARTSFDLARETIWTESNGTLLAVNKARELGLRKVVFEGDASWVIHPIYSSASCPHWLIMPLIGDEEF